MRITESRLRRIIRSIIVESVTHESLKKNMLEYLEELSKDLQYCESGRDCAVKINKATGKMSDAWNSAGGSAVGFFVDECSVGQLMDEMQQRALEGSMMNFEELLDEVENEIEKCDFSELSGHSGTDSVRQHISSNVNNPGAMGPNESVLRRVIRKELNRQ